MDCIEGIIAKGVVRYNSTTVEEMDLGHDALQITSYMSYNERGNLVDTGK